MLHPPTIGIDISKASFHAAVLRHPQDKPKVKSFANTETGFADLVQWLKQHQVTQASACLEATSTYGHPVARYLDQQGYRVSIVNPLRVKGFAQSQLTRTKNDQADAGLIARYAQVHHPAQWHPPTPERAALQEQGRHWQALAHQIEQDRNRLETTTDPTVAQLIRHHIDYLKQQQQQLLDTVSTAIETDAVLKTDYALLLSIPAIGRQTALLLLAELGDLRIFTSARQLAAFAGLTPQEHTSGSSVQGKTRLCKIGSPRLRFLLYMPALVALRFNPAVKALRERLLAKGKAKMQVVGAAMHKLIRLIYGVIHSGKPFDPTLHPSSTPS